MLFSRAFIVYVVRWTNCWKRTDVVLTTSVSSSLWRIEESADARRVTSPSESKPTKMCCEDAFNFDTESVISHKFPNGAEQAVAHAFRTLGLAEKNHGQIERGADSSTHNGEVSQVSTWQRIKKNTNTCFPFPIQKRHSDIRGQSHPQMGSYSTRTQLRDQVL